MQRGVLFSDMANPSSGETKHGPIKTISLKCVLYMYTRILKDTGNMALSLTAFSLGGRTGGLKKIIWPPGVSFFGEISMHTYIIKCVFS